ncbi:hypothetical protein DBR32_15045 [Taibaiella sp. KBW10]|uniref:glycosyltransferase family 2 protein n=1 Tax=Taibaiella sp. KBW10 TaxID=2153357 RepID=UPI000F595B1D|nr:glycosyltransferase family 2 protein [Taibaiella sp. KBW10]RQO29890.1 hypothetical protein DBR32_15045 [Taibaiella sp. KBW10]
MEFSVCIISNVIDPTLIKAVTSYRTLSNDILIGFNGLSEKEIDNFQTQYPFLKTHLLPWTGYGPTKNALAALASHDWILSIDSDEIASTELQRALSELRFHTMETVYCIKRAHFIGLEVIRYGTFGSEIELKRRLYNRTKSQWDKEKVHEALIMPATATFEVLEGILYHYTAESVAQIQLKNEQYARLSAENMFEKGKKYSILKPYLSGFSSFMKQYIFKKGFLDGKIGYQLAKASARYAWMKYDFLKKLQQNK